MFPPRARKIISASMEPLESRLLLTSAIAASDAPPFESLTQLAARVERVAPSPRRVERDDTSVVNIPDQSLLAAIRYALKKPQGPITQADMLKPRSLEVFDYVADFTGLEYARNLTDLTLDPTPGKQLQKLADPLALTKLTRLSSLAISNLRIDDLSFLDNFEHLKTLSFDRDRLPSLRPLVRMPGLENLMLSMNSVRSYGPLSEITTLKSLNLSYSGLKSMAVRRLPHLSILDLSYNRLSRVSLQGLPQLKQLFLNGNRLARMDQVHGLGSLPSLRLLNMGFNGMVDAIPPAGLGGLTTLLLEDNRIANVDSLGELHNLLYLAIDRNRLTTLDGLGGLDKLRYLNASSSEIKAIGDVGPMSSLEVLDLSENQIAEVGGLSSLRSVAVLDLSHNQVTDASPLDSLQSLADLDLSNNRLTTLGDWVNLVPGTGLDIRYNAIDLTEGSDSRTALAQALAKGIDVIYDPQSAHVDTTGLPVVPAPTAAEVVGLYQGFHVVFPLRYGGVAISSGAVNIRSWNPSGRAPNGQLQLGNSIGDWFDSEPLRVKDASFVLYASPYTHHLLGGSIHRGWIALHDDYVSALSSQFCVKKVD